MYWDISGYAVHISSVKLDFYGGKVTAGEEIGKAVDRNCFEEGAQKDVEPHIEMKLYKEGKLIDPTYHLQNCKLIYFSNLCQSHYNLNSRHVHGTNL
ncbi:hypothetical protein ANCCAN_27744 [Ancylostoma caninum]|uniref:Peptidase M23 domain-containing protein n=1 Tax=Ancylostoma caninum TaxID=29170 RepID=A0A368F679_ANCCA|nr:hypothetical protein ANCCAN_27744 [Ancylostoma caninum]